MTLYRKLYRPIRACTCFTMEEEAEGRTSFTCIVSGNSVVGSLGMQSFATSAFTSLPFALSHGPIAFVSITTMVSENRLRYASKYTPRQGLLSDFFFPERTRVLVFGFTSSSHLRISYYGKWQKVCRLWQPQRRKYRRVCRPLLGSNVHEATSSRPCSKKCAFGELFITLHFFNDTQYYMHIFFTFTSPFLFFLFTKRIDSTTIRIYWACIPNTYKDYSTKRNVCVCISAL